MSTNKLKPEQIKAFKEKEAEVFKADEDGLFVRRLLNSQNKIINNKNNFRIYKSLITK